MDDFSEIVKVSVDPSLPAKNLGCVEFENLTCHVGLKGGAGSVFPGTASLFGALFPQGSRPTPYVPTGLRKEAPWG